VCFHCGQIYHIYVDLWMLSSNNVCLSYLCGNLFVIYGPINYCCMSVWCVMFKHDTFCFISLSFTSEPNMTWSRSILLYLATKQKTERLRSCFQTWSRAISFSESGMESFRSLWFLNQTPPKDKDSIYIRQMARWRWHSVARPSQFQHIICRKDPLPLKICRDY
jgi:hypothetical protein